MKKSELLDEHNYVEHSMRNIFLMIPYFFLLHHFYRADVDDATP